MDFEVFTLRERPDLAVLIDELSQKAWPEFLLHGDADHWNSLFDTFADFQLLMCDPQGGS